MFFAPLAVKYSFLRVLRGLRGEKYLAFLVAAQPRWELPRRGARFERLELLERLEPGGGHRPL